MSQLRRLPEAQGPRACTNPGASRLEALGTEKDIEVIHLLHMWPTERVYQVWRACNYDSRTAFELLLVEAPPP